MNHFFIVVPARPVANVDAAMSGWHDEDPLVTDDAPGPSREDVSESDIKTYKRRWYILAVFCLMTATQALAWNTWAPISQAAEAAFGWNDSLVGLLTSWGPIMYTIFTVFMAYLMDVKGTIQYLD